MHILSIFIYFILVFITLQKQCTSKIWTWKENSKMASNSHFVVTERLFKTNLIDFYIFVYNLQCGFCRTKRSVEDVSSDERLAKTYTGTGCEYCLVLSADNSSDPNQLLETQWIMRRQVNCRSLSVDRDLILKTSYLNNPDVFFYKMAWSKVKLDIVASNVTHELLHILLKKSMVITNHITLLDDVKLISLLLHNVLTELKKVNINLKSVQLVSTISVRMARVIRTVVLNDPEIVDQKEVMEIAKVLLNILELCITTPGVSTTRSIDLDSCTAIRCIEHWEQLLENLHVVLSTLQTSDSSPKTVTSNNHYFTLTVLKEDLKRNISLTKLLQKHSHIPVSFASSLMNRVQNPLDSKQDLSLGVATTNKMVLKSVHNHSISNLIFVFLTKHIKENNKIKIESITFPVDVELRLHSDDSSVQVSQTIPLDPTQDEDGLDSQIRVHRFEPGSGSQLVITFLYPPTSHALRVLVVKDCRPSHTMMMTLSTLITRQAPCYSLHTESDSLYYMGVIPGPDTSLSRSISFSFTVNSATCVTWDKVGWSPAGCRVGPNTRKQRIHCQCKHLSIFAAIFPYMPNKISPISDVKLFLTLRDNPIVPTTMIMLYILYLFFCFVGRNLDKKDSLRGTISFLEDNYPCDKYPYLLAVFTSSRLFAGTTSHVGIQIFGQQSSSRAHILKNEFYQVLGRQSDDWFLILCPKHLDVLEFLHLWHDNTGSAPDWYCDKIHIFDLETSLEYLFIVEQWIRLNVSNFPEALVMTASSNDILKIHRVLSNNIFNHLRDYQSIVGIFTQHPRNTVKRLQRVNIFSCNIWIAVLCNIMFYKDTSKETIDDYTYNLETRNLYVSFIAVAAIVSFNYMASLLFKKSYNRDAENTPSSMFLRKTVFPEHILGPAGLSSPPGVFVQNVAGTTTTVKAKSIRGRFVRIVKLVVISQKLVPAILPYGSAALHINKRWFMVTWMVCTLTRILCTYFILLYSFKMGYVKSKRWLTTGLVSFMENKFIINPMNLILIVFSVISSFGFVRGTTNYRVTQKEINISVDKIPFKTLYELYQKRQHPMYTPLDTEGREELLRKNMERQNKIKVMQFVLSLSYVICITCFVQRYMHTSFLRVSHLKKMFDSTPWLNSSISFHDAHGNAQLNNYLTTTFLYAIFRAKWYNKMSQYGEERSLYRTSDYCWQMIGVPYIRQKRVFEKMCRSLAPPRGRCIPQWSPSTEETDSYDVGWTTYSPYDVSNRTFSHAWRHSRRNRDWMLTLYRLQGKSGTIYDNGGYGTMLGSSLEAAVNIVGQLTNDSWVDEFTKVMFMELVVYNVNVKSLSQITLIMEFLTSGVSLKTMRITSDFANCEVISVLLVAYIVLTLVFVIEMCYEIKISGIATFCRDMRNVLLVAIIIPSIFVNVSTVTDIYYCKVYQFWKSYYNQKYDYNDFDTFITFDIFLTYVLSFFFLISVLRTLLLIRNLKIHFQILKYISWSFNSLFFLLSITSICFVFLFKILIHLDVLRWDKIVEIIVVQKKPQYVRSEYFSTEIIIFSFFKFFTITLISSLIVSTFVRIIPKGRSTKI